MLAHKPWYTLQSSSEEEHWIGVSHGKHQGAEEHDGQTEHHGPIVAYSIDNGSANGVDKDLDGGLGREKVANSSILAFVLDEDAIDVNFARLIDGFHAIVPRRVGIDPWEKVPLVFTRPFFLTQSWTRHFCFEHA